MTKVIQGSEDLAPVIADLCWMVRAMEIAKCTVVEVSPGCCADS